MHKLQGITVPVGVEVERMMNTVIHNENGGGNKTCKRFNLFPPSLV